MKIQLTATFTILAALLLASCQGLGSQPQADADTLPGLYTGDLSAASSPGRQFFMTLTNKNEAIFSVDYRDDQDAIIQIGTWALAEDGMLSVALAAADGGAGESLRFAVSGDALALKDNPDYGSEGLTLKRAADDSLQLVPGGWMWLDTTNADDTVNQVIIPTNFTVLFMENGDLAVRLDCNRGMGAYTIAGQSIDIKMGPTTLMACPEPGLGTEFAMQLDSAAAFFFQQGQLFLEREADGGSMRFVRVK